MSQVKSTIIFIFFAVFLYSCHTPSKVSKSNDIPEIKNIILLIGDGMGLTQLSTSYYYGDQKSNFSRFKKIGLHQNVPSSKKITDSAAGATAFSTGYKTYNAAIGVDEDTIPRTTILEMAKQQGKSTGVIATSSITHATPASFFAHVSNRNYQEEIALEFVEQMEVDFTAGGGSQFFSSRKDGKNLLHSLQEKGFVVDTQSMENRHDISQRYVYLLAQDAMPKMQEGRGDFLPHATQQSLDYLSQNEKGFFLMVEGSQIDWGGHSNDADYIINEVQDFDQTIGLALDFAEKNGETLVIVTADHETGGFALSAIELFGQRDYVEIKPTFSTGGHTATLIPVFAYGPGSDAFMGIYQNNEIFKKMTRGYLD